MPRAKVAVAFWVFLWAAPACVQKDSSEPLAEVIVELDAEPELRLLAKSLRVEVYGADGLGALPGRVLRLDERVKPIEFPKRVALTPVGRDERRVFVLTATAFDMQDAFLAQARIVTGYVPHGVRYAKLTLEASACLRRQCEDDLSTCTRGDCIDARVDVASFSSDPDRPTGVHVGSEMLDGGVDGSTDDGGKDAEPAVDTLPDCLGRKPGDQYCHGNDRMTCGPNLITAEVAPCPDGQVCVLEDDRTRCEPDTDECALDIDDCDPDPDACLNVFESYECECPSGYHGSGRGDDGCTDIDECATDNGGCDQDPMAICTEEIGAPSTCSCPSGYEGKGTGDNGCLPVDACSGVSDACATPGTQCEGDTLVSCALNADGCLQEVRVDCTGVPNKNSCDPSLGGGPSCGVDPCKGLSNGCSVAGVKHCDGDTLIVCESTEVTLYGVVGSCLAEQPNMTCGQDLLCCDGSGDPSGCDGLGPVFPPQCFDPFPPLTTCTAASSTANCGTVMTATGRSLPLGSYGAVMEPNVGSGFENAINGSDNASSCSSFITSLGSDPIWSAEVLDIGSLDLALYTVFRPVRWTEGTSFPVLIWGNGTCQQPSSYGALLRYVASYGFVVIAPNSRYVGSDAIKRAIDFAVAANQDSNGPYFGRLDTTSVAVFGHSQGGMGSISAASDDRVSVVALLNAGSSAPTKPFLIVSADLDLGGQTASSMATAISGASKAAYLFYHMVPASSTFEGLLLPARYPERLAPALTGWFQFQLHTDATASALFVGPSCGLCNQDSDFEFGEVGL